MDCGGETSIPARNVLIMIGMAAGTWALIFVTAAALWPRHIAKTEIAFGDAAPSTVTEGEKVVRVVSLPDRPRMKSRAHSITKVKGRKRPGRSWAARVFNQSTSIN
jgi:hypothetical protein